MFNMQDASVEQCPTSKDEKEEMSKVPYQSAVGSLIYAMLCIRPDSANAVGVVSRFMRNPGEAHCNVVKWILRYLKGTSRSCLCFESDDSISQGYTDADYSGDADCRKSTSRYRMTYAGDQCHGNRGCRNVCHYQQQKLST
jgi:hypothetical protein